jgi:hypothetical protein
MYSRRSVYPRVLTPEASKQWSVLKGLFFIIIPLNNAIVITEQFAIFILSKRYSKTHAFLNLFISYYTLHAKMPIFITVIFRS